MGTRPSSQDILDFARWVMNPTNNLSKEQIERFMRNPHRIEQGSDWHMVASYFGTLPGSVPTLSRVTNDPKTMLILNNAPFNDDNTRCTLRVMHGNQEFDIDAPLTKTPVEHARHRHEYSVPPAFLVSLGAGVGILTADGDIYLNDRKIIDRSVFSDRKLIFMGFESFENGFVILAREHQEPYFGQHIVVFPTPEGWQLEFSSPIPVRCLRAELYVINGHIVTYFENLLPTYSESVYIDSEPIESPPGSRFRIIHNKRQNVLAIEVRHEATGLYKVLEVIHSKNGAQLIPLAIPEKVVHPSINSVYTVDSQTVLVTSLYEVIVNGDAHRLRLDRTTTSLFFSGSPFDDTLYAYQHGVIYKVPLESYEEVSTPLIPHLTVPLPPKTEVLNFAVCDDSYALTCKNPQGYFVIANRDRSPYFQSIDDVRLSLTSTDHGYIPIVDVIGVPKDVLTDGKYQHLRYYTP